MSHLIQRPEYIKYLEVTSALGIQTSAGDFEKIEEEKALFQWALPHCFKNKRSPWVFFPLLLSIFWVPYFLVFFRAVYVNIFDGGEWFDSNDTIILWGGGFVFVACVVILYLVRLNFYNVAYKITESGLLIDEVKSCPKSGYSRQSSEKFIPYMQLVAVPLIILAIFVNPLLLAGAGAMVFYAFLPAQVTEAHKALYFVFRWDKLQELEVVRISTQPKRFAIRLGGKGVMSHDIYCSPENYEQVVKFLLKTLPNATYNEELYGKDYPGLFW